MKTSAYTPFEVGAKDRIVGFFVIGALLLFLLGFLIPFIQRLGEEDGIEFYTLLDQTYGIAPEASVSLRGVVIGKVTDIGITQDGIEVYMSLSREYEDYYTYRSKLLLDTNIGVNTILSGSGLILHPGDPAENEVMKEGEFIPTEKPGGISSLLEQLDIPTLTTQVSDIVANVESITSELNSNQEKLYRSLDNLEVLTANLTEVTATLPGMVKSVDESLVALQASLDNIDTLVTNTDENLQVTLTNAVTLTDQATKTLAEAEVLFRNAEPVLKQLPTVMVTTDIALQSIAELSNQMSRSWLLGGDGSAPPLSTPGGPAPHPHDDEPYNLKEENRTDD